MFKLLLIASLVHSVWLTPGQAERLVRRDADPGQFAAVECEHHGPRHHGGWRRWECVGASESGCLSYVSFRITTHGIRYRAVDILC